MAGTTETGRIEVRTSVESKVRLQETARITRQDLSSFVLDCECKGLECTARGLINRFSDGDLEQLEAALVCE